MGFDALQDVERRTNGLGVLCFCWPGSAKIQNSAAIDGPDCGHLTTMSDVYSFGVVLLEILSGKRAMDKTRPVGQHNLVEWCRPYLSDGNKLFKVIDTRLDGQYSIKGSQTAGKLAHRCLNRDPKRRPKMAEIVDILEQIQNLKDMAKPST